MIRTFPIISANVQGSDDIAPHRLRGRESVFLVLKPKTPRLAFPTVALEIGVDRLADKFVMTGRERTRRQG